MGNFSTTFCDWCKVENPERIGARALLTPGGGRNPIDEEICDVCTKELMKLRARLTKVETESLSV